MTNIDPEHYALIERSNMEHEVSIIGVDGSKDNPSGIYYWIAEVNVYNKEKDVWGAIRLNKRQLEKALEIVTEREGDSNE